MDKKLQAAMLFKMHLRPHQGKQQNVDYYRSTVFTDTLVYAGELELGEDEKIAIAYPNYTIIALFHNGDLVEFSTEGRYLNAVRVFIEPRRTEILEELRDPDLYMEETWEEIDDLVMPNVDEMWRAPL